MGKGFVFCAVVCSALALSVYAGLYEFLGVSASVAVFLLLGICLLFHGAALYTLKPRAKSGGRLESDAAEEQASGPEMTSNMKEDWFSAGSPISDDGVPVMASDAKEAPEHLLRRPF